MEKLILTKNDIDSLISKNIRNLARNRGGYGVVIPYNKEYGLKFRIDVFNNKSFDHDKFMEDNKDYRILEAQIAYLSSLQSKIKLTELPKGVAYYENKPIAVILKYFYHHKNLYDLYYENNSILYKIMTDIITSMDELMKNGIYQLDAKGSNFLYSAINYKLEPIDLDGKLVHITRHPSSMNINLEERVYEDLFDIFETLIHEKLIYHLNTNHISNNEFQDKLESLKYLRRSIGGIYVKESAEGYLSEIQKSKIMELKKK